MKQKMLTKWGYDLFEVASAFQKSIRRAEEDHAMFWAVELFESGYDLYLWKRIKIITSEDVGLAAPMMPAVIHALYTAYMDQKKKGDDKHRPERLFLTHAVLALCRAPKSRLVDNALLNFWGKHYAERMPVPEYALDKHNGRGRSMGRGWKHFFDEGTKLANHEPQPREEEYKEGAELYGPAPVPEGQKPPNNQGSIF